MLITINQDIRKYKTKDIGPLSFREAGFTALAVLTGALIYKFTGGYEMAILPMGFILMVCFFKPFGMTFIQFLRTVGVEKLTPKTYIWETDFEYDPNEYEELYGEKIQLTSEWSGIQNERSPIRPLKKRI